jgi:hypothetical protein
MGQVPSSKLQLCLTCKPNQTFGNFNTNIKINAIRIENENKFTKVKQATRVVTLFVTLFVP